MAQNNKQTYGVSTSIISIASHKCSFCKNSICNIQVYSNLKRKNPIMQNKMNNSLKFSFFYLNNLFSNKDKYSVYVNYKPKNFSNKNINKFDPGSDNLEFVDIFSCKCGKLYLMYNHTEGLKNNYSINKARRSKKSFNKRVDVSSFF